MARERIKAILESNEAKGRMEQAKHLALETDLAAPDALALLRGMATVTSIAERQRETVSYSKPL